MPRTVVLIDDEPDLIEMLSETLKQRGFEVHAAGSGKPGLELVDRVHPDVVICDLMMPGMSGLEVCRTLRSNPETKDLPIVVISALGSQSDKPEEFWAAGLKSDDFISKPFETDELMGRLEYVLRKHQYVSTAREKAVAEPAFSPRDASPEEVVKAFIQSWNEEEFGIEYQCMDATLTGGLEANEYMARRRAVYMQENGRNHRQMMQKIIRQQRTEDQATLVVERKDTTGSHSVLSTQEYKLKKTEDGWKISGVRKLS